MSYLHGSGVGGGMPTTPVPHEAQERLLHTEQSYARKQQELQSLVQTRASTPMSAAESGRNSSEIAQLQQTLRQMEAEINTLKATNLRQMATIKTQSEAIANPKKHYVTPVRFRDNQPHGTMPSRDLSQVMPPQSAQSYNRRTSDSIPRQQPYLATAPLLPSAHDPQPQPTNIHDPFCANRNASWNQQLTYQPQGPQVQQFPMGYHTTPTGPSRGSHGSHGTPFKAHGSNQGMFGSQPQVQQPSNPQSMALVPASVTTEWNAVKAQLAKVWGMAEAFSRSHVNIPSTARDNAMPQKLKDTLLNAATRTTAFQFMSTPLYRYFLVTKVIVQWLMNNVLKVDSFAGFDTNTDRVIESCRNQIYQSTPAQVKFQLLTTIGQQMAVLQQNPRFETFLLKLARDRGNMLWPDLQMMMHQKSSRDWDDLLSLMTEAHRTALLMYSGPDEYRYEMPQHGQPFTKETMEPRDSYMNGHTPEQLEAMGTTVRLAFTPHVTVRTNLPNGHVTSRTLLPAYVLLKVGK
ncbi:hypothetical protein A1O3_03181 [Capronia epimyces CBS 606.96]|uniref:Uncharacterized protein n=1 Tax=Capronia epimyces CBS 606.96 TaxID=1182542 RepID=W9YB74_9EURO|nr:uncharacterized protein A1O3_03181 [Capronia epimyces CBS 606.96]EXJ90112.1 hypothetical protein A1O3_03181 [Capronia epimyces CBS 606.96]